MGCVAVYVCVCVCVTSCFKLAFTYYPLVLLYNCSDYNYCVLKNMGESQLPGFSLKYFKIFVNGKDQNLMPIKEESILFAIVKCIRIIHGILMGIVFPTVSPC